MTTYLIVLFLHLVAAIFLFAGFGIEWAANAFLRRAGSVAEAQSWLRLVRIGPLLTGPSLGILILSGGHLAYITGTMKQPWLPISILAIIFVFVPGIVIHVPRLRAIRDSLSANPSALTPELTSRLRDPLLTASVRTRAFLGLGIVFLMTAKPTFELSVVSLLGFVVLGALFSFSAMRKKNR